jgi:hypothetical protein
MFQEDYLRRLIELGEEDAERQWDRIGRFIEASDGISAAG